MDFFDCGFAASHCVAATNDAGIYRRCYNENPILCSCSAHEYGSALATPVTVRSVGAVPSTIAATMRGDRKARGASRSAPSSPAIWSVAEAVDLIDHHDGDLAGPDIGRKPAGWRDLNSLMTR